MKKRIWFLLIFLFLVGVEFIIGIFVHDSFIRPYFGDVLIVIVLYAFARILFPDGLPFLSAAIFLFAVAWEFTQMLPLCDVLGIQNRFIRVLMGTSFAWGDILAYLAGTVPTALHDLASRKHSLTR